MTSKFKIPSKDVDTAKRALILNSFMKVFPLLAILGLLLGGVLGLLIAFLVSIVAAMVSEALSDFFGGSAQVLYGVGRRTMTVRDQLAGTMSKCEKCGSEEIEYGDIKITEEEYKYANKYGGPDLRHKKNALIQIHSRTDKCETCSHHWNNEWIEEEEVLMR